MRHAGRISSVPGGRGAAGRVLVTCIVALQHRPGHVYYAVPLGVFAGALARCLLMFRYRKRKEETYNVRLRSPKGCATYRSKS